MLRSRVITPHVPTCKVESGWFFSYKAETVELDAIGRKLRSSGGGTRFVIATCNTACCGARMAINGDDILRATLEGK